MIIRHDDRIIEGSSSSLTCTVVLSPEVDVSVNVNTVWTGPSGTMFTQTNSQTSTTEMMTTEYNSTTQVNAARSGSYTCQATVHPKPGSKFITASDMLNRSVEITVGRCLIIIIL